MCYEHQQHLKEDIFTLIEKNVQINLKWVMLNQMCL